MRTPLSVLAASVAALAAAGCSAAEPAPAAAPVEAEQSARNVQVTGTFTAPGDGAAVTYDEALVPVGARPTVTAESADTTTVTLEVAGLRPNRAYGAHAHTKPCGGTGDDAGPHYQFEQDPVTPSVDPAFANPENEIWLDFSTDDSGAGTATATVDWAFPADRRAESVIIHGMPTATGPGEAGTAGERPACVTVDF